MLALLCLSSSVICSWNKEKERADGLGFINGEIRPTTAYSTSFFTVNKKANLKLTCTLKEPRLRWALGSGVPGYGYQQFSHPLTD